MATMFEIADFRALGVCRQGLDRVAEFGGKIENTAEGWGAYVAQFPDAWRAPLFTAWRLRRKGWAVDPDLIWKIARIAFREAAAIKRLNHLGQYAETLGPDNWREASVVADADAAYAAYAAADADAAYAYADADADAAYAYAAAAAADAAYAYAAAAAAYAYAAADADAAYAYAAADADAAAYAAAAAARRRVRAEIVALAVAALVAADPQP